VIGSWLLRLLYKFSPSEAYSGSVAAISALGLCGSPLLVDVGGGAGGLWRALRLLGCIFSYYLVVEVDDKLASMSPRGADSDAVVASACFLPLRPVPFSTIVFNDSLHHMHEPLRALGEAARVDGRCIVVSDFDASKPGTLFLKVFERLLGFPARFLSREAVESTLVSYGYQLAYASEGRLSAYTLAVCRRRQGVD